MTKEEYLKIRDQSEITVENFFEYYLEMGGYIKDFTKFNTLFSEACMQTTILMTASGQKQVNYHTAVNRFYNYYNKKFNI